MHSKNRIPSTAKKTFALYEVRQDSAGNDLRVDDYVVFTDIVLEIDYGIVTSLQARTATVKTVGGKTYNYIIDLKRVTKITDTTDLVLHILKNSKD